MYQLVYLPTGEFIKVSIPKKIINSFNDAETISFMFPGRDHYNKTILKNYIHIAVFSDKKYASRSIEVFRRLGFKRFHFEIMEIQ